MTMDLLTADIRERLLANRRALPVHHEQLVVLGEFLHQPLEGHRAHRDA